MAREEDDDRIGLHLGYEESLWESNFACMFRRQHTCILSLGSLLLCPVKGADIERSHEM